MGCDIHCYVEYRNRSDGRWQSFGGRINPGRNYTMFGILAGVRREGPPIISPRGMPSDPAFRAEGDNFIFIVDHETDEEGCCSREEAARWHRSGSKYVFRNGLDKAPTHIEHPDWHTHSWLKCDEFRKALEIYDKHYLPYREPEYHAVLAAMEKLEEFGFESRIVFWFDN